MLVATVKTTSFYFFCVSYYPVVSYQHPPAAELNPKFISII
jgi:hypothetical protein